MKVKHLSTDHSSLSRLQKPVLTPNLYPGLTRLSRLHLIGTSSRYLGQEALHLAIAEAQQGRNVSTYLDLAQQLHSLYPSDPLGRADQDWVDAKTRQIAAESEKLENELKGYKNNLIKESIRVSGDVKKNYYLRIICD